MMETIQKSLLVSLLALNQLSLFATVKTEYPVAQVVLAHEKALTKGVTRRSTAGKTEIFQILDNEWGKQIAKRLTDASYPSYKVIQSPFHSEDTS